MTKDFEAAKETASKYPNWSLSQCFLELLKQNEDFREALKEISDKDIYDENQPFGVIAREVLAKHK